MSHTYTYTDMQPNEITVNLTNVDQEKPVIVHMLKGELPRPINFEALLIEGNINAVMSYIVGKDLKKIKPPQIEPAPIDANELKVSVMAPEIDISSPDTFILIDDEKQLIKLFIGHQHPQELKVFAQLEKTNMFKKFGIEEGTRYNINQLKQLIRTMRPFFPDKAAHGNLLINLGRTDLKINQTIKEHSDDRGNINNVLEQNVISNIDERFTLQMPIFKGVAESKFEVNVLMEVRDKGVSVWLESVEALEIARDIWETIKAEQQKTFLDRGFTVITE